VKAILSIKRLRRTFSCRYNDERPHRSLDLRTPDPRSYPADEPPDRLCVQGRDVLGGLIHEYDLLREPRIGTFCAFSGYGSAACRQGHHRGSPQPSTPDWLAERLAEG